MTTTHPSANDSWLNLDRLEALARAATPGTWLHRKDPRNSGAMHCVKLPGERGEWVCDCIDNADVSTVGGVAGERNASFIAAANPAAVLELIALARCAALANQPAPTVPAALDELTKALQTIARWQGEFPDTGKTWADGSPMSYAACYGSNGERDYMRQIALDALAHQPAQEQEYPKEDGYYRRDASGAWKKAEVKPAQEQAEPVAQAARALLDCCDGLPIDTDEATAAALTAFDRTRSRLRKALAAQQEPVAAPQQAAAPGARSNEAMSLALSALGVATTPFARDRQTVLAAQSALLAALRLTSAPGTPEAPGDQDAMDAARYRSLRGGNDYERDNAPMVVLYERDSDKGERPFWAISGEVLDQEVDAQRATQLDGGQEGSE